MSKNKIPTAIEALQAIADLPHSTNLEIEGGKELAYRAVENLFNTPPNISVEQKLEGHNLLKLYIQGFESGAQGCEMDYDSAQALAVAMRNEIELARKIIHLLTDTSASPIAASLGKKWIETHKL